MKKYSIIISVFLSHRLRAENKKVFSRSIDLPLGQYFEYTKTIEVLHTLFGSTSVIEIVVSDTGCNDVLQ